MSSRGWGSTLGWQRCQEGPLVRDLSFCPCHGETPRGAALTPQSPAQQSPAQPRNPSPDRGQLGVNHFQYRPKEVAIKELVSDRKSFCAALTPSAAELLQHLPAERGEAAEPAVSAGCSIPASPAASLLHRAASLLHQGSILAGMRAPCHRPRRPAG